MTETLHTIPFSLNWKEGGRNRGLLASYDPNYNDDNTVDLDVKAQL
jgi:hypothetical protein